MRTKYLKLYDLLIKAKEIQLDVVSNDGLLMVKKEREKIVNVWNSLDKAIHNVYGLINKP